MPETPSLPNRTRVLVLRAEGLIYAQIAAEVGLSRSRVGQIVKQAETRALIHAIRHETTGKNPAPTLSEF